MEPDYHLRAGMLVQLNPHTVGDKAYGGCILVVLAVHLWGVDGYIQSIGAGRDIPGRQALYRANWNEIEMVGIATWMASPGQPDEDGDRHDTPGI